MKRLVNNHGVHVDSPLGDWTLCGDALEGDPPELQPCRPLRVLVGAAITCEKCIAIINHVRGVAVAKEQP